MGVAAGLQHVACCRWRVATAMPTRIQFATRCILQITPEIQLFAQNAISYVNFVCICVLALPMKIANWKRMVCTMVGGGVGFTLMNASVCAFVSAQLWHLNSFAFRVYIQMRLYIYMYLLCACHVHFPTPLAHSNRLWLFYCRAFAAIIKSSTLHCHQYIIYIAQKGQQKMWKI